MRLHLLAVPLLVLTVVGCGSDPAPTAPTLSPDDRAKIRAHIKELELEKKLLQETIRKLDADTSGNSSYRDFQNKQYKDRLRLMESEIRQLSKKLDN